MKRKNPHAAALGKRRWRGLNAEARSEANRKAAATRLADTTPAERSELMRRLVKRRWNK